MSYSINEGYTPLNRSQMLTILFNNAVKNGYTGSFQDFKGSNIHKIHSDTTLPYLEQIQAEFFTAQMAMFSYFSDNKNSVYGSFGASYEGWYNNFVSKQLARGINMVDSTIDPSLGTAGNIALYFDMLSTEKEEVPHAFLKCIWPGMVTPRGDQYITLNFSAANGVKTYQYYNLHEDDYTQLDLHIMIKYKNRAMQYEPPVISESVKEQFDSINRIGMSFYPNSYFDHQHLSNIATMEVWSSLAGEENYSKEIRMAEFGQKFVIHKMEVLVHE